jgi:hypothetical protein
MNSSLGIFYMLGDLNPDASGVLGGLIRHYRPTAGILFCFVLFCFVLFCFVLLRTGDLWVWSGGTGAQTVCCLQCCFSLPLKV